MKIKELVKLEKLLLEYGKEFHYGGKEVSCLVVIISSVRNQIKKIHEYIVEHRWESKPR